MIETAQISKMADHITDLIISEVDNVINGTVYNGIRDRIELDINHVGRSIMDNMCAHRSDAINDLYRNGSEG